MNERTDTRMEWWGEFLLKEGESGTWVFGEGRISITRTPFGWRTVHRATASEETALVSVIVPDRSPPIVSSEPGSGETSIFSMAFEGPNTPIGVFPTLPDKPIVVRPVQPVSVQTGQSANLFVSSSLWFRLEAGNPRRTMWEVPLQRPSDTWFGPSTREGELCYAVRIPADFESANLEFHSHRATIPLRIKNASGDVLPLLRVRIPVQHLSLFMGDGGILWTETVTITLEEEGKEAELEISSGPPHRAGSVSRISGPRIASKGGLIKRALDVFFHQTMEY